MRTPAPKVPALLFHSATYHASISCGQPRRCFDFRRYHQLLPTRRRIRHRSRLSEALRRMQLGAAPGFVTDCAYGVAAASALRGATDVACRELTPVASARRHPKTWNKYDQSDHLTAGCAVLSSSSNITGSGHERRILANLWQLHDRTHATSRRAHPGAAAPHSTPPTGLQPIATSRSASRRLARSRGQGGVGSYAPD